MNFLKKTINKSESLVRNVVDSTSTNSFRGHHHPHEKTFLHGYLLLEIIKAKDLPNMESWISQLVIFLLEIQSILSKLCDFSPLTVGINPSVNVWLSARLSQPCWDTVYSNSFNWLAQFPLPCSQEK